MRRSTYRSGSATSRRLWFSLSAVLLGSISFVTSSLARGTPATSMAAGDFAVTGEAVAASFTASAGGEFVLEVEAVRPVVRAWGGTFELYPDSTGKIAAAVGCPCQSTSENEIFSDGFE